MRHIIGLSGGKDSTALALRLAEVEPRDYDYLITPTGNELPEMTDHWARLEEILGKPLIRVHAKLNLIGLINFFNSLPNHRQRWCTRMLKIQPTIAWIQDNNPVTLYVGLRADEETREGIYDDRVTCRFPLREWGWRLSDVQRYLAKRGVTIPRRTDCAFCWGQRLSEWRDLWRDYPELYQQAISLEQQTGHTFRSANKDKWPASLTDLAKAFADGRKPANSNDQINLFGESPCRVCSL